ncbi:bifunctional phosphopantothenoylcysteine decarboxylase/phosphopantothenate--cysteine ligase CoaBC [Edaphobacter albus]|uniref:bifunctional phosphopantothenoylcysteine decarboxylase/phosphopantothenate--cysteine ligase CoaBC n=1 Tax=Edaphobacter sp. 4G125 TaxID=2763071 RepID=UPI0016491951|nr:bifunctional phosphopantothenoylcysteine decarboxylase/phosphopantothenate--cysteine ligase CoaBC [Edaphobacter sp. 4G125]QNI36956.1 bifunctional phosphopantothenoylcysteine decarboxylase/phosphopantothenate--cysteine ligase CoaBC [Edaphobacter sp. 4G125]
MATERVKVTVAVTGGIAAYKAVEVVRQLQDAGFDPHVVMTEAAEKFIQPLTFSAITGHKVISSLWSEDAGASGGEVSGIEHINEAQTTAALIVVPATANILAKFAHGVADDFLTTMYLATTAPVIVAPAMNVVMWQHPATQTNLEVLRQRGVTIVEPNSGYLACGMVGGGRLAEESSIVAAVAEVLSHNTPPLQDLAGETVLITAGGTREPIDPVRFIGNRSSGKMGYALAARARCRGARVILISAPTSLPMPEGCEMIPVTTAEEMRSAVLARFGEASLVVMAAAVSDYRVAEASLQKIRREGPRTLQLEPTSDILREIVERKKPGTLVVGFAAETENVLANGRAKLARKGVDALVVNDVSGTVTGFDSDRNAGWFLTPAETTELQESTKIAMADRILTQAIELRSARHSSMANR